MRLKLRIDLMPSYFQASFHCPQRQVEALSDFLEAFGAVAVRLNDAGSVPIYEPAPGKMPLWQQVKVIALFTDEGEMQVALDSVSRSMQPCPPYELSQLEDRDWVSETQSAFPPQCIGGKFWVYPDWQELPQEHQPALRLAPGLGFGTGQHPSTHLCLEALVKLVQPSMRVVDYGCGSGILGLAALILGADQVLAVDIDPQALEASAHNAALNGVNQPHPYQLSLAESLPAFQADLLVANILAGPLEALKPVFQKLLAPQGQLILAGLLTSQAPALVKAYSDWKTLETFQIQEDWVCLTTRTA